MCLVGYHRTVPVGFWKHGSYKCVKRAHVWPLLESTLVVRVIRVICVSVEACVCRRAYRIEMQSIHNREINNKK